jgi:hypothetical protein
MSHNLVNRFKSVYPTHPIPKRILTDERDNSEFSKEIRKRFTSKPWTSVTLDDWINTASIEVIASYMPPEAFQYYLPSIICSSLDNKDYIDWGLRAILPPNQRREAKGDWWIKYVSCFNSEKKKVLQEYIRYILERSSDESEEKHLATIALEKIWT